MDFIFLLALILMSGFYQTTFAQEEGNLKTYIVHVMKPDGQLSTDLLDINVWHHSFLPSSISDSNKPSRIVHSYRKVITGFAAKLSPEEVREMEKMEDFATATPEEVLTIQTTESPNFLGLHQSSGFWDASNYGEGIIIGVLDTGILPQHPSFHDEGMPSPPTNWKGKCEFNYTACNKKLIGARNFYAEEDTPLDENGHGTHTASTAAGNFVKGANVYSNAKGIAAGIAPLAHLAMYKVCSATGDCPESGILAAIDAAIEEGVHILSISLSKFGTSFYRSVVALGGYSAMEKGIFVSCSAGNNGPDTSTLANGAPWVLTVGASTINRKIKAIALLGNNKKYDGESIFQPHNFPKKMLPLVYAGSIKETDTNAKFCDVGSFNSTNIKGKIILCDSGGGVSSKVKGQTVKDAGGAAMILVNHQLYNYTIIAEVHVLPAVRVSYLDGLRIKAYINSRSSPKATILFKGTIIGDNQAPIVAAFSSRGPNLDSPGILKPDIIGPGVNILAAWPFSVENKTNTDNTFNIISGTSMSCPHLSGVAALLKNTHPDWSPATIKSAIITTAYQLNLQKEPIVDQSLLPANILATGAGHVNPSRANEPGLVYDLKTEDYIPYLCGLNYTDRQVGIILQRRVKCSNVSTIKEAQLNYPSFSIKLVGSAKQTYKRVVTNVGEPNSSYIVKIVAPTGVDVNVKPTSLHFTKVNQKMIYQVTFHQSVRAVRGTTFVQGFLAWTSTKYIVRSPILVRFTDVI